MALLALRLPVPVGPPVRICSHLACLVVSATFRASHSPPASSQDLTSPPLHADSFRPVGISALPATVEDPMDGQDAVIKGTNPGRGPTTGGIEICIYGTNLPNGSTSLYARFGKNVARVVSTSELLRVSGFNLVSSRPPFSLAYHPVSCRLETIHAGFRSPFREDPPPTLLLLEKVSANLSITRASMKGKPGAFLLFAYLPPTQSRNSRPHPQKLHSRASSCLGAPCQRSEQPHSRTGRGRPRQPGRFETAIMHRHKEDSHIVSSICIRSLESVLGIQCISKIARNRNTGDQISNPLIRLAVLKLHQEQENMYLYSNSDQDCVHVFGLGVCTRKEPIYSHIDKAGSVCCPSERLKPSCP